MVNDSFMTIVLQTAQSVILRSNLVHTFNSYTLREQNLLLETEIEPQRNHRSDLLLEKTQTEVGFTPQLHSRDRTATLESKYSICVDSPRKETQIALDCFARFLVDKCYKNSANEV
ncbi:hypothetical protein Droror1_Dr00021003 [Drosera rotundifolia]